MGWLFGKKKIVPKVPLPESKPFNEKSLQFSRKESKEKVIEPEHIKEAVGMGKPIDVPEEIQPEEVAEKPVSEETVPPEQFSPPATPFFRQQNEPLFVKVSVYQKIINEIGEIKSKVSELKGINKDLEKSEYNEEKDFLKLRRTTKVAHDKLLQIDKIIFKGD